jgi:hypothetical protein
MAIIRAVDEIGGREHAPCDCRFNPVVLLSRPARPLEFRVLGKSDPMERAIKGANGLAGFAHSGESGNSCAQRMTEIRSSICRAVNSFQDLIGKDGFDIRGGHGLILDQQIS